MRDGIKRRRNIFRLGRRGRRSRVAYDTRWGHVLREPVVEECIERSCSSQIQDRIGECPITTEQSPTLTSHPMQEFGMLDESGSISRGSQTSLLSSPGRNQTLPAGNTDRLEAVPVDDPNPPQERNVSPQSSHHGGCFRKSVCGVLDENRNQSTLETLDLISPGKEDELLAEDDHQEEVRDGVHVEFDDELVCGTSREHEVGTETDELISKYASGDTTMLTTCEMLRRFRKTAKWQNILSILLVSGSVRFSVEQFELFRACVNLLLEKLYPGEDNLPAYSTIERTLSPILRSWGYVPCETYNARVDFSKAGAGYDNRGVGNEREGKFIVIKPSTWTTMDVSFHNSWQQLKCASHQISDSGSFSVFQHIENTPILRRRDAVLNVLSMFQELNHTTQQCQDSRSIPVHDYVYKMKFRSDVDFPVDLLRLLETSRDESGNVTSVNMRPLKTFLVNPGNTYGDVTKASREEVELGGLSYLRIEMTPLWLAGDFCTSLRTEIDVRYVAVLVHHQARPNRFSRRLEVIFIPYSISESTESSFCTLQWNEACKVPIFDLSLVIRGSNIQHHFLRIGELPAVPSYGKLRVGMRYFVDHILLYSDGFSQYRFKQGSSAGVYSISLNYPPFLRRTRERVRVLALTPPGISTKEGIRSIIPDLVKCCTEGIMVRNADGENMMMFIDVVGYVGDYPEVAHMLDILGQTGRAPCHLCSFLRFKGHHSTASRYGYTTEVHSESACYARTGARTRSLRESTNRDDELVLLGLNPTEQAKLKASPLFELHDALRKGLESSRIPLTEEGVPVVHPTFDPYRSVFIYPDHVLAGKAINEINCAFKALPNVQRRKQADEMICFQLRSNGLKLESRVFNLKTSTTYTTSISGTFCILLVAAPVFTELVNSILSPQDLSLAEASVLHSIVNNLCLFRRLVSRTYWYPKRNVDDPRSVSEYNMNGGLSYITALQDLCKDYITKCNDICKRSSLAATELDKPNLHRLLELFRHSIPAIGHVQHFAELVFECAHQPLKRAMAKSNYRDSHLQSVRHAIADDWKRRLAAVYALPEYSSNTKQNIGCLVDLLCGRNDDVRSRILEDPTLEEKTDALLQNEMIKKLVSTTSTHLDLRSVSPRWYLTDPDENRVSLGYLEDVIENYLVNIGTERAEFFRQAKRMKVLGTGPSQTTSHPLAHDLLTRGMVVQALLADAGDPVLEPLVGIEQDNGSIASLHHYAIEALFSVLPGSCYAVVRRCVIPHPGLLHIDESAEKQILRLTDSVRSNCLVHACHRDTKSQCLRADEYTFSCDAEILTGNLFYFFSREQGYPPRMA